MGASGNTFCLISGMVDEQYYFDSKKISASDERPHNMTHKIHLCHTFSHIKDFFRHSQLNCFSFLFSMQMYSFPQRRAPIIQASETRDRKEHLYFYEVQDSRSPFTSKGDGLFSWLFLKTPSHIPPMFALAIWMR